MMKQFIRKVSMVLAVCMLLTALPIPSLAQEAAATAQAAATAAPTAEATTVETVPAAGDAAEEIAVEPTDGELAPEEAEPADGEASALEEAEPTDGEASAPEEAEPADGEASAPEEAEPADGEAPEAEEPAPEETAPAEGEAASIVSFALAEEGIAVPRGTAEADLGLPAELTATFSDGTSAPVAVVWVCVDDGNGGTVYSPENSTESVFTFQAVLAEDIPCEAELPAMGVAILDAPMPLAGELANGIAAVGDGEHEQTSENGTITLIKGNYSIYGPNADKIKIIVCAGASLEGDDGWPVNADIVVDGGTLSISGPNGIKSIHSVVLNSGRARIARGYGNPSNGPIPEITVNGGTLDLDDTDVSNLTVNGGSVTMMSLATVSNLTATGGEIEVFTKSEIGTANLKNCSIDVNQGIVRSLTLDNVTGSTLGYYTKIDNLHIESIPTSGELNIGGTVGEVTLGDSAMEAIAKANWPAESAVPGETPKEVKVEYPGSPVAPNLKMPSSWSKKVTLTYVPVNPDQVLKTGDQVAYNVSIVGATAEPSTVTCTVPEPLYLLGGTIVKDYDGSGEFTDASVNAPVWVTESGAPYVGDTSGCTVTVSASVEGVDAQTYASGEVKVTSVQVTGTAPEGMVFSTSTERATGFGATINKAEVSISGTIYRNGPEDAIKWQDALGQPSVTITGLAEGETIENWDSVTLMSPPPSGSGEYINSLTGDIGNVPGLQVWEIALNSKNYVIGESTSVGYDLYVEYRSVKSNPTISKTAPDWYRGPGELPLPVVIESPGSDDRPVKYQYRKVGEGDDAWTEVSPTQRGKYEVRAVLAAYDKYVEETTEPKSFNVENLMWKLAVFCILPDAPAGKIEYGDAVTVKVNLYEASLVGPLYYDFSFKTGGVMTISVSDGERDEVIGTAAYDEASDRYILERLPSYIPRKEPYIVTAKYEKDGYSLTRIAYLYIYKKDASGSFLTENAVSGTYDGTRDSGAEIRVSTSFDLTPEEDLEISVIRNDKEYPLSDGDLEFLGFGQFSFKPLQAGEYRMTVTVKEDNPCYTGSYTSDPIAVVKRPLKIAPKERTLELGQPFTPAYDFADGTSLAGEDRIVSVECQYMNEASETVELSELVAGETYSYSVSGLQILTADGVDVTDSYDWSSEDASLNVTLPKTEIAMSYAADRIEMHKTLSIPWTPDMGALMDAIVAEALFDYHILRREGEGYVEVQDEALDAGLSPSWRDADGQDVLDERIDAGDYKVVFELHGGEARENYALRLGDSPDTLTFNIQKLDVASPEVTVDIADGIYNYEASDQNVPSASLSVKVGEHALVAGTDYEVVYPEGGNTQPGKASLKIVGIGNCMGERDVDYNVVAPAKFTITIPASVPLGSDDGSMRVGCTLQGSNAPDVSVTVNSANNFGLCREAERVDYCMYTEEGGAPVAQDSEVARFAKLEGEDPLVKLEGEQVLTFAVDSDRMINAGTYVDQLTFTAHLK